MNARFKRDKGRNYILFCADDAPEAAGAGPKADFQTEMIRRNRITGLAPFHVEWEDGKEYHAFDITGKQQLSRVLEFEPLSMEMFVLLLTQIAEIIAEAESYMLDRNGLLLTPEYIYADRTAKRFSFLFCADNVYEYQDQIKRLAEFLMSGCGAENTDTSMAAFGFYKQCIRGGPEPDDIMACVCGDAAQYNAEAPASNAAAQAEEPRSLPEGPGGPQSREKNTGLISRIRELLRGVKEQKKGGIPDMEDDLAVYPSAVMEKPVKYEDQPTQFLYVEEDGPQTLCLYCGQTQERVSVDKSPFFIGSQEGMDYILNAPGISRMHAKLEDKGGQWWITDLNSTNGTQVNGRYLDPNEVKKLGMGDTLRLAGIRLDVTL